MAHRLMILDGATGTELERHGAPVTLPLWSAEALIETPDVIRDIHKSYLDAGATAITTATFRTHRRSLARAGLSHRASELTTRAVELARQARDDVNPDALILGSVAPLEDCYRADLTPDRVACEREHGELIRNLVDAGADMILIETMIDQTEAMAAVTQARRHAGSNWMISFCTTSDGPPGQLLSGQPLVDLLPEVADAFAVGVNCIAAPRVIFELRVIRAILSHTRLMAYANVGHANDDGSFTSDGHRDPEAYADHAEAWVELGASVVGGCCGTTPEMIRAIRDRFPA